MVPSTVEEFRSTNQVTLESVGGDTAENGSLVPTLKYCMILTVGLKLEDDTKVTI